MRRRIAFGLLLVAAGALAAAAGYRLGRELAPGPDDAGGLVAADLGSPEDVGWLEIPTPDVEFRTAEGGRGRLSDYRGRIVLLNFWGTWCPPCRVEIPHLVRVQEALEEVGGTVIGPAVDSGSDREILRFADEARINYPVWIADYDIAVGKFGAGGYPFTLLIDRDGIIRKTYLGPQTERTLMRDIRVLLAAS